MLIGLVPVFNEEENVIKVLSRLEKQVDYIIVINDGSFDKTDFLISNLIKVRKNIYYLSFQKNKGMSYALFQGFNFILEEYKKVKFSDRDLIVTIDADGQHNPEEIRRMHEYFDKNNIDVLIAKRDLVNYPRCRIFGNRLMSSIVSCLTNFKFEDVECGLKILRVVFIPALLNYYIGFKYSCAGEIGIIASLLGYKVDNRYIIQVPYYRKRGPRFVDLFINLTFYFLVFLKIKFKRKIGQSPL